MTGREIILGRIREALKTPARSSHHSPAPQSQGAGEEHSPRHWLPQVPDSLEGRLALFAENAAALKAAFHRLPSLGEAARVFAGLCASQGWNQLASHRHPLTQALAEAAGRHVLWIEDSPSVEALEACQAGLTACEALIAQTGTVLVSSKTCGGRNLSVLPPAHIVIARENQMTADLSEAFELARAAHGGGWPGMLSLITGPSRTGDIERILVLGAHGPKQLHILLVP
ncbi:MAG: LUD domain-containing protein [Terrimicrobiaceae bacterium]|nr:LUD domain-containing protein [Terrimicrobiaceae bacterium]